MTEPPRFHRYRFTELPEKPKIVRPLAFMNWEERFMAAWEALLVMECRAERAEQRIKDLLNPPPSKQKLLNPVAPFVAPAEPRPTATTHHFPRARR